MVAFLCWSAWPSLSLKLQGLHLSKKVTSFVLGRGNKGSQPRRATEQLEKKFTTVNLPSKGASETQDPCTALTWSRVRVTKTKREESVEVTRVSLAQPIPSTLRPTSIQQEISLVLGQGHKGSQPKMANQAPFYRNLPS